MEILTKVNSLIIKLMERGFTNGRMEKFMMDNGYKARKKVMVSGEVFMETVILENGKIVKLKVMEFICGKMETGMKESG